MKNDARSRNVLLMYNIECKALTSQERYDYLSSSSHSLQGVKSHIPPQPNSHILKKMP